MDVHHPTRAAAAPVGRDDFDGDVHMIGIRRPDKAGDAEVLAVYFPAGGRTRPHYHEVDQVLHATEGQGVVAIEGEKHILNPGDIVIVPAHTWHWHGATPDSDFCHISIKSAAPTNWDAPEQDWAKYMDA